MKIAISRRRFLEGSGSLVVTFSLGALAARKAAAAGPAASKAASAAPAAKTVALDEVDGFIAIGADGKVTVYSGRVDLGTGVRTALAQIAAEELCVPLASIEVVQGDTLLTPDQGPTYGSLSIQNGGTQIRQAAGSSPMMHRSRTRTWWAGRSFRSSSTRRRASRIRRITPSWAGRCRGSTFPTR